MYWAKVRTRFEGVHCWSSIPADHPKQFLKNPHRHEFHVMVMVAQVHHDRDIEYLVLKDQVNAICRGGDLDSMSCEMLCDHIFGELLRQYPERMMRIEVTEDGENGAYREYA